MARPSTSFQPRPPPEASVDSLQRLADDLHYRNGLAKVADTSNHASLLSAVFPSSNTNDDRDTVHDNDPNNDARHIGGSGSSPGSGRGSGSGSGSGSTSANWVPSGGGDGEPRQGAGSPAAPGAATGEGSLPQDPSAPQPYADGQNGIHTPLESPQPPSASMSNPPQLPGPPRQPVSYPSSTSFSSPGLPAAAQYTFPPQPSPPVDPYRASPGTLTSTMALPSMRTLDHVQAQQMHGMPMPAPMGAPMHPIAPPTMYYGMPHHTFNMHPDPTALRFALAPNADPRIALSGGRHKKEIKRRTKTGCLTCRKRRIKCDETHPTCNNCKKSKRECLGYDPIFKQQQGPPAIQPAPNSQTSPSNSLISPPSVPASAALPFQPPIVPSSYPPSVQAKPTLNPALSSASASVSASTPATGAPTSTPTAIIGAGTPLLPTLAGSGPQLKPSEGKKMKIDGLIALGAMPAPPGPAPPSGAEVVDELIRLYYEVYVPGLNMFFETSFYDLRTDHAAASNPLSILRDNKAVMDLFATFLHTISGIKTTNPSDMVYSGHLETCLISSLARLAYSSIPSSSLPAGGPHASVDDAVETRNRLLVFETLLSGDTLHRNPLQPPPAPSTGPSDRATSQVRINELDFWYHLSEYIQASHFTASQADTSMRELCLARMRSVLDGRENRDVLYSIAVLREYAPRFDPTINEQTVPSHLDEMDPRSKLAVATRFIRDEAASTGGTTNVVRRFADLAYRAFVRPGVNIDRSTRGV
ncbi:hypothetical protein VTK73DRAFT_7416 [Phialemonium thermophilum]|uniref:Zn(2)-C6 fungal-type domain-containing protein n=1 Tax=Phialemonium thermophilum TaxID=223376 RepID=A0ABR3WET7_9PEZI